MRRLITKIPVAYALAKGARTILRKTVTARRRKNNRWNLWRNGKWLDRHRHRIPRPFEGFRLEELLRARLDKRDPGGTCVGTLGAGARGYRSCHLLQILEKRRICESGCAGRTASRP